MNNNYHPHTATSAVIHNVEIDPEMKIPKSASCINESKANAKVAKKTKIKAGQEARLKVYPSKQLKGQKWVFRANQFLANAGFKAKIQEIDSHTGIIEVIMKNVTMKTKSLFADRKIGLLTKN